MSSPDTFDASALDPEIRQLVLSMMPQARSEAWKVFAAAPHALDKDDLTSLAYTGLMMAAVRWPRYCAERGFDPAATQYFAAYCLRRIRGAMLDALRSADWVTRSMRAKAKMLADADAGHGKSEADLVAQTGLKPRQVRDTLAGLAARPVSLDAESHDVADPGDVESQVTVSAILAEVLQAMDGLDGEIQVVLALRFHQGLDFEEIAGLLSTSVARATELHNAGVLKVHDVMLRSVT